MSFEETCSFVVCAGPLFLAAGYLLYSSREKLRAELTAQRLAYDTRLTKLEALFDQDRARIAQLEQVLADRARAEGEGIPFARIANPLAIAEGSFAGPAPEPELAPPTSPGPAPEHTPELAAARSSFARPLEFAAESSPNTAPASAPTFAVTETRTDTEAEAEAEAGTGTASDPAPSPAFAPAPAPAPAPASAPASAAASASALEEWLGLRGAAALGAIVLVIAAAYFFKYSIDHGLLSPLVRLLIGALVGCLCLVASETDLQRKNSTLAQFLGGAGSAILYFASWASAAVYGLIPYPVAFALMAGITALTGVLAARRDSMPTAILGLLGGFASPLLLSRGEDHPIALFSYLGLLDVGLIVLARQKRWPSLVLVSVVLTAIYELGWILGRMDPGRHGQGGSILVGFLLLFALFARLPEDPDKPADDPLALRLSRLVGLATGLVVALDFASLAKFGPHFGPIGVLFALLTLAAVALALRDGAAWLGSAAAAAVIPVALAFQISRGASSSAWELDLSLLGLGAIHLGAGRAHLFRGGAPDKRPNGAAILAYGIFVVLLTQAPTPALTAPAFLTTLALATALLALESFEANAPAHLGLAFPLAGAAFAFADGVHVRGDHWLSAKASLGVAVVALALSSALGSLAKPAFRRSALAGSLALALVLALRANADQTPVVSATLQALLLGACIATALAASARLGTGAPFVLTAILTMSPFWVLASEIEAASSGARATVVGVCVLAMLAYAALPLLPTLRATAGPARAAASAIWGPIVPCFALYETLYGKRGAGLIALAAAAPLAASALLVERDAERDPERRTSSLAWLAAAASMLLALAFGIELRKEWLTIAWAVEGALLLALFRRIDHVGLKALAATFYAVAFLRLTANAELLRYHAAHGMPVFNWLLYTYAVPVVAMIAGMRVLRGVEVGRLRPVERSIVGETAALSNLLGLGALVLGFVWANLTVLDAFSASRTLSLTFERLPARDLSLSGAWAAYSLLVVGLGIRLRSMPLRLASLLLLLGTAGKVFLYDLGALRDLYRVASLVGLALTLIAVSLAYQRFVFKKQ